VLFYCTVRLAVFEWIRLPLVPVIVNAYTPLGVALLAFTVGTEEPPTDRGPRFGRSLNLFLVQFSGFGSAGPTNPRCCRGAFALGMLE